MLVKFNKFVDYFIHPRFKIDKSQYESARIYVLVFLIIFAMGLFYSGFYISKGIVWDIKSFHNYLGFALGIVGLIIIKETGKTEWAMSLGAIIGAYLVTASVYLSGGIVSNDILWYTVLSAATFMFIGIRTGFIIFIISFSCITFFYILESFNIAKFKANSVSNSLDYRFFNFVLILSVLTLMVYVLVSGNKKLQAALQLNREQKLREEIARDFHDQIGNKLASVRHLAELAGLNKTDLERQAYLSKIDTNAKDVYDNFRDFIWTLDAKSDKVQELFMYLRDFADDYFKFSTTKMYISSFPEMLPNVILSSNCSREIVPIFKEALTNVYRHSGAKNSWLTFTIIDNRLEIKLKDDGRGVDGIKLKKGNGLKNMKSRAEKSGGKFQSTSSINEGTEISYFIELPFSGTVNG